MPDPITIAMLASTSGRHHPAEPRRPEHNGTDDGGGGAAVEIDREQVGTLGGERQGTGAPDRRADPLDDRRSPVEPASWRAPGRPAGDITSICVGGHAAEHVTDDHTGQREAIYRADDSAMRHGADACSTARC